MSIALMETVCCSDLPMASKFVLQQMANYANDDGFGVRMAVATIAKRCSMDRRTVQRQIRDLIADKLLIVEAHATGGRGQPTLYRIDLAKLWARVPGDERRRILRRFGEKRRLPDALSETAPESATSSTASEPATGKERQADALSVGAKGRHPRHKRAASTTQKGGTVTPDPVGNLPGTCVERARAREGTTQDFDFTEDIRLRAGAEFDIDDVARQWAQFTRWAKANGRVFDDVGEAFLWFLGNARQGVRPKRHDAAPGTGPSAPMRVAAGVSAEETLAFAALRAALRERVDRNSFKSWLAPLALMAVGPDGIVLGAPTNFMRDWVERSYLDILGATAGRKVVVVVGQVSVGERVA